ATRACQSGGRVLKALPASSLTAGARTVKAARFSAPGPLVHPPHRRDAWRLVKSPFPAGERATLRRPGRGESLGLIRHTVFGAVSAGTADHSAFADPSSALGAPSPRWGEGVFAVAPTEKSTGCAYRSWDFPTARPGQSQPGASFTSAGAGSRDQSSAE